MITEEQEKFARKVKEELDIDIDMSTYTITRGRGWSKENGSCGACVKIVDSHTYLLLSAPLRKYNQKKIRLSTCLSDPVHPWIPQDLWLLAGPEKISEIF